MERKGEHKYKYWVLSLIFIFVLPFYTVGKENWYSHYGDYLKNQWIELPYDPTIPLLYIDPEETKTERDICTPMFIEVLFTIARTWKQPRCPSGDE